MLPETYWLKPIHNNKVYNKVHGYLISYAGSLICEPLMFTLSLSLVKEEITFSHNNCNESSTLGSERICIS